MSAQALESSEPEIQKEVMKVWFLNNYEDPVHSCPHDSSEGGYVFVYGGPYDAHEELEGKFAGIVDDEVIEDLAKKLSLDCPRWSGDSSIPPDYGEDWDYLPSEDLPKHLQTFYDNTANIRALLEINVGVAQQRHFRGMLYVSAIIAMESYLLDNFLSCIDADEAVFRKYIETTHHFMSQRIALSSIFKESEGIGKRGRSHLTKILWHRLNEVGSLYQKTLGVQFPEDMKKLSDAVQIRHDFVHRNGRTPDGKDHDLTVDQIKELIQTVEAFVDGIEKAQRAIRDKQEEDRKAVKDVPPVAPENAVTLDTPDELRF